MNTPNITVSRELLRQAIEALNEADNVLTSSMFAEAATALRAALEQPAVEQAEKLDPLTQLQVAYVMGLRDANSAPQPAPVQEQQPAPASKPVLLQCLGCERVGTQEQLSASTDCDCWLHTQPAPVQEPSHDVVAGAIFDFAGFLTSHKVMIEVGSCSNASPMVERIKEWSGNRGLSLENPDVFGWQMRTAQPRKAVKLSDSEILTALDVEYVSSAQNRELFLSDARTIEQAVWAKLGVSDD